MKKIKNALLVTMLLLSFTLTAQKGLESTIVTSLQYESSTDLEISLKGDVEVAVWDKDFIGVVIDITTNLQNSSTLGQLIRNDRYFINSDVIPGHITTLSSPFIKKQVTINKIPLIENIRYKLFVPQYAKVQVLAHETETMAQIDSGGK